MARRKLQPKRPSNDVALAYCHPNEVAANFHHSLLDLWAWDASHDCRLASRLALRTTGPGLVEGRNQVAAGFLDSGLDWLFWLDADMGFRPDTLDRLLATAAEHDLPVVGALCFAWKEVEYDGMGGYRCEPRPTLMDFADGHFIGRAQYEPGSVVQVAGTGSACILVHRSAVEAAGERPYDRLRLPDGVLAGEDVSFCMRLGAAGIPIWVDTGVMTNHQKQIWVSQDQYAPWLAAAGAAPGGYPGYTEAPEGVSAAETATEDKEDTTESVPDGS